MPNTNFLPPKGFRDLLPKQMAIRNKVTNILKQVFESYGFQPLQTPTIEYASTLKGKYGEEADKLLYLFSDRANREIGLNYDLTVPTARVLSAYSDFPMPFKRYQIQPAYRAEKPQKGRYRQFTQCDVDIIGNATPEADAEILAVINSALTALGFSNYTIKVNSRTVLFDLISSAGIPNGLKLATIQTIDKLDKKTKDEVVLELENRGVSTDQITKLFSSLETAKPDEFLQKTIDLAIAMGVPQNRLVFTPALARGLDYYNGPIYETVVTEPKIGSLTGGGRYDNLIGQLGGPNLPATGTTLGLDRLCDVVEELNFWPDLVTTAKVLVTVFSTQLQGKSLDLANQLRTSGINTELYLDSNEKLDKQLKYANKKGIPFVAIIGEEEATLAKVTLKDMTTGKQQILDLPQLIKLLETNGQNI